MPTKTTSILSTIKKSNKSIAEKDVQRYAQTAPASRQDEVGDLLVRVSDDTERQRIIAGWWDEAESGKFQYMHFIHGYICICICFLLHEVFFQETWIHVNRYSSFIKINIEEVDSFRVFYKKIHSSTLTMSAVIFSSFTTM